MKRLDPVGRLDELLPWINGDSVSVQNAAKVVREFMTSFDGSESSGHMRVGLPSLPPHLAPESDRSESLADQIHETQIWLTELFAMGFEDRRETPGVAIAPEAMSVGAGFDFRLVRAERQRPSKGMSSRERRDAQAKYTSSGAWTLVVDGPWPALVPYLVARVLTMPGGARVGRCQAPARFRRSQDERCNRLLLLKASRGRPRLYCSPACKTRALAEQQQKAMIAAGTSRRAGRR